MTTHRALLEDRLRQHTEAIEAGAQIVNEPESLTWNELITHDLEGSKKFYNALFGWNTKDVNMGQGHEAGVNGAGVSLAMSRP